MADRAVRKRRGLRAVVVACAVLLALAGLTACRTNVGTAATVDGQRISESDVNDYVTSKAQPIDTGSSTIAPRSYVLGFLIEQRLISRLFATPPASAPSRALVDASVASAVDQSGGRAKVIDQVGLSGYTSAFVDLFIRTTIERNLLFREAGQDPTQTPLSQIAQELKFDAKQRFPVSVNPRYGSWDAESLSLNPDGALPSFLTLQPTPAPGA